MTRWAGEARLAQYVYQPTGGVPVMSAGQNNVVHTTTTGFIVALTFLAAFAAAVWWAGRR